MRQNIAAIVLVVLGFLVMEWRVGKLADSIDTLTRTVQKLVEDKMTAPGTLHEEWWGYSPNNVETLYFVDTKRNSGESLTDWYARHDADVATQRAAHPAH